MLKNQADVIVAQATPPGKGGVGIIRVSGSDLEPVLHKLIKKITVPRMAEYLSFYDSNSEVIDTGLAIYFPAPHSFTGEDVLELHGHGGQVVMDLILQSVMKAGARIANPGEFSYRAFMNDKLDLAQAEAISDLINSTTEVAARSATRSLKGEFSKRINILLNELIYARMYVESSIDFPEEEIDFLEDEKLHLLLRTLIKNVDEVFNAARQGYVLNEGMTVVIAGQPNAGKSSLLNRLAGHDAAIVTEIAGTTRDVLKESIHIDGMPLHIIDTAGLRDDADIVEREGIRRAWQEIEKADHILLMIDDLKGFSEQDRLILDQFPNKLPITVIHNKIDVSDRQPGLTKSKEYTEIYLSAKNALGMDILSEHLRKSMGYEGDSDGLFIARRRHLDALERAKNSVETGYQQMIANKAGEFLAEDLRYAQMALNEITGEFDNEDLLGEIFSSFCIGK